MPTDVCGRYELHSHPAAIALVFGLAHVPELAARYNIAPMTDVPVVRVGAQGERELVHLRWGFVPRRAHDAGIGERLVNARAETAAMKPSFRMAFRRHRCLLPADGFFEWQSTGAGPRARRHPVHVSLASGGPMGLAGLYERWLSPAGDVLDTCTILTTAANEALRHVHERMPLVIAAADFARWLDPAEPDVEDLVRPYPASELVCRPVSDRVNAVRNDDARLIEPVAVSEPQPALDFEAERVPEQESLF